MPESLTVAELVLRIALAMILGGAIGWDRERKEKAAGLRTMILVSLGAAGAMLAAIELSAILSTDDGSPLDPIRAISGIIGGVGFLGAGAIIHAGGNIRGLTTAASIWVAACIGLTVGAGLYVLAITLAMGVFLTLVVVTSAKGTVLPDKEDARPQGGGEPDADRPSSPFS